MKSGTRVALSAAVALALGSVSRADFYIGQNFSGSNFGDPLISVDPPEAEAAAGPNQVVEFINDRVGVYAKTGGPRLFTESDVQFWTAALPPGTLSGTGIMSPRIVYDSASARWFAAALDGAGNSNRVLVAVSISSDPTGAWKGFSLPADTGFSSDTVALGVNADGVFLSTNAFNNVNLSYAGPSVVSIPKPDLLAGAPTIANRTTLLRQNASTIGFNVQPAVNVGPSTGREPLLAVDNEAFSKLNRTSVLNASTSLASLSAPVDINVATTSAPPTALQPAGATPLYTNDDRIDSTVYQVGNYLYAVQTIGYVPPGAPGGTLPRAAIRWYKIDESTNATPPAGFSGTISAAAGDLDHDYFAPSIAANQFGDVVIGFNRSGTGEFVGSYAEIGHTNPDGTVTFSAPQLLKAGASTYVDVNQGINRWSDYSSTTVDPADPSIFWTTQEYPADQNLWSLQMSEIIVPQPGEVRWKLPSNGTFAVAGNWLNGGPPTSGGHAVFSIAGAYTVTFGGEATNDRLSVRQGTVTFNLAGNTYSLSDASTITPSAIFGEFGGLPRVTFMGGGQLSSVTSFIAPSPTSDAAVTISNGVLWSSMGSVYVGGTSSAAGGKGVLSVPSTGAVSTLGTLKLWNTPGSAINLTGGTITAASLDTDGNPAHFNWTAGTLHLTWASGLSIGSAGPLGGALALAGGQTLLVDGTNTIQNAASLTVGGGTFSTSAVVNNGQFQVSAGSADMGDLSGSGATTASGGQLTANRVLQSALAINGTGAVKINPNGGNAGTSVVGTLSFTGGATPTGKLNLSNNDMIVSNAALSDVRGWIISGYNIGTWTGTGIYSDAITPGRHGLAYAKGDDPVLEPLGGSFDGQPFTASSVIVKFTYIGDANMDGSVDGSDVALWAQNFSGALGANPPNPRNWTQGDWNYDGSVDGSDVALWAQNFTGALGGGGLLGAGVSDAGGSAAGIGTALVPEPSAFGLLGLGAAGLLGRRKRL